MQSWLSRGDRYCIADRAVVEGVGGIELSPVEQFSPLAEAHQLLSQRNYREAHRVCRSAIERDPGLADAYYVMGIIAYEHQDIVRAQKLFEKALENGHPEAGPRVQLARCLALQGQAEQALAHIRDGLALGSEDRFTLSSAAAVLSQLDRHEDALDVHRAAAKLAPNDALIQFNLASALQFTGQFEAAREVYRRCLEIAPQFVPPRFHLAMISKHTPEENDLAALQEIWDKRHPQDVEGGLQAAHALAKINEDLGHPDVAMDWLDRGKALFRQRVPSRRSQDAASYSASAALARSISLSGEALPNGPIFIAGLPRTGTTLTDRILSSHSGIVSAGERSEFAAGLHRQAGLGTRDILDAGIIDRAGQIDLAPVGRTYLDQLSALTGTDKRFTDKMPINAFYVPAILKAIPNARVICLRRHPADSVLSIYRQFFAVSAVFYRYAYDLEDLAYHVSDYLDLLDVYDQHLPASRFRIVDYEDLVDQPEATIRDILSFSGLEFEPDCLDFQNNAAPVATASVVQVRQPIFKSSKGRWERYRSQLQPALTVLEQKGRLDPN